jgi:acetyltransferase
MNELDNFFAPKSVAVVGVSEDPGKLGSIIFNNLLDAGFKGELYPINPKYQELFWHKSYANISDIEGDVDLAVIVVPSKFVAAVMEDAGRKGVKSAIIITAGFKEIGAEGKKLEDEMLEIAKKYGIRIIGPNCLGIIAPEKGVNASFAASTPKPGNIAFLSQSGAYCTAILDMAIPTNLGFSHFVSFGNKSDIDEIDMLKMLSEDKDVKVIGAYLEEVKFGQEFIQTIHNAKVRKPTIILKAGQTEEAKKAIVSHTGAIAGSIQTFKTAMKQSGIIEANSLRDLFNLMMAFSWSKLPKGDRVAVVTNAGGPGIVATDLIIGSGMKMAEVSPESLEKLAKALPPTANLHNPVDVIGDALADRYQAAVQTMAEDDNVDAIVIIITPQLITQIEETAKIIINAIKVYNKPIIPILLGDKYMGPALSRFYDNKFAAYRDIKDGIDVLRELVNFHNYKATFDTAVLKETHKGKHHAEVAKFIDSANALPDEVVKKLADEVGLVLPQQKLCASLEEAVDFCKEIYPVVIKASNAAIAHKTDFKALYLNLENESDLRAAYTVLEQTIKDKTGLTKIEILVQEQIKYEEQMFIGANRDGGEDVYDGQKPGFGHLIVFGQGGIYTEIYKDMGYALLPTAREYIAEELETTRVVKVLNGARGKDKLAKEKYIDAVMAVQRLVALYPEIKSLDINPLLITKDRVISVDIKIFV